MHQLPPIRELKPGELHSIPAGAAAALGLARVPPPVAGAAPGNPPFGGQTPGSRQGTEAGPANASTGTKEGEASTCAAGSSSGIIGPVSASLFRGDSDGAEPLTSERPVHEDGPEAEPASIAFKHGGSRAEPHQESRPQGTAGSEQRPGDAAAAGGIVVNSPIQVAAPGAQGSTPPGSPTKKPSSPRKSGRTKLRVSTHTNETVNAMLMRLQSLPWNRVDVTFKSGAHAFNSHNHIKASKNKGITRHLIQLLVDMEDDVPHGPTVRPGRPSREMQVEVSLAQAQGSEPEQPAGSTAEREDS
uniref:Uncharacterized protein n=1 Tax=Tetraselmis sp. GSL018 TaxID=582737 RepID=A0A061RDP5_9CHLO